MKVVWIKKLVWPGLALIAATGIAYSVQQIWSVYMTIPFTVGVVVFVASLMARGGEIRSVLACRKGRYGMNAMTSIVLLIGVLGIVNYISVNNDQRLDLTAEGFNSLADQSVAVAEQITEEVHIRAFYPTGDDAIVRQILNLYQNENALISYEFIDPDSQPLLSEQFDVTVYGLSNNPLTGQSVRFGTLVMEMNEFQERVESEATVREEDITNALMKLFSPEFMRNLDYVENPHGSDDVSGKIIDQLRSYPLTDILKKSFFDIAVAGQP